MTQEFKVGDVVKVKHVLVEHRFAHYLKQLQDYCDCVGKVVRTKGAIVDVCFSGDTQSFPSRWLELYDEAKELKMYEQAVGTYVGVLIQKIKNASK